MAPAYRGQAVRAVGLGVAVAADAEHAEVQQRDRCAQDAFAAEPVLVQSVLDDGAHFRQPLGELQRAVVLMRLRRCRHCGW